jgi:hypothetical protein
LWVSVVTRRLARGSRRGGMSEQGTVVGDLVGAHPAEGRRIGVHGDGGRLPSVADAVDAPLGRW